MNKTSKPRLYFTDTRYDELVEKMGKEFVKSQNIFPESEKGTRGNRTEIQKSIHNSVMNAVKSQVGTVTIDGNVYLLDGSGNVVQFKDYYRTFSDTFSEIERDRYTKAKKLLTNGKNVGKSKVVSKK